MKKPPLLYDVYCGAGGATKGYQMAGFRVIGVDNKPQPRYCGDGFIEMDALVFLDRYITGEYERAAAFHASPPCQGYCRSTNIKGNQNNHERLILPTREKLQAIGKPYIIENVPDARNEIINPIMLCGTMFGLRVRRHRYFECSFNITFAPAMCGCHGKAGRTGAYRSLSRLDKTPLITVTGHNFLVAEARIAMGIDWMIGRELQEAIPPAYTKFIGSHLIEKVDNSSYLRGR